jgi:hypothetical protein
MTINEIGQQALKDYKSVKYFPFKNFAGAPFILTAEPFSYLEAFLQAEYNSIKKDTATKKKKTYTKAIYFTKLSNDFYKSSLNANMPSKGTLLYYSFINLVKVYLLTNGYDLETKTEHHGLSLPANSKDVLKLLKNGDGISIYHEFAKTLGKQINNDEGLDIKLADLIRDLPEVHEIAYALDIFGGTKRKFLPVDIQIRTNNNHDKIFYTISYEKKFDKLMRTEKLGKNHFKEKLDKIVVDDDLKRHYFQSKLKLSYTPSSERSWKMCYPKIVDDINNLNIFPIITRQGYRYYLDLEPSRLHRLSNILGFAYYIGTVARYRPTLNEEILKGKYQAIINEAIISCPNQFFYLLVSYITKQVCAIPMSKID